MMLDLLRSRLMRMQTFDKMHEQHRYYQQQCY